MDKIFFSLGVAALGMMVVFAGLVILIGFISILTRFTAAEGKKKSESKSGEVKPAAQEASPEVVAAVSAALAANDGTPSADVVAAISAALTVVMGETGFVVRHVRRISNAPAWNRAGREEQVYSRF